MKAILFAAALSMSAVAIAQEDDMQDTAQQPSGETVDDPSQATGPQGVTQQGTVPNGQAAPPAGTNQMPMGTNQMPMGTNQAPMSTNQAPMSTNQAPMGTSMAQPMASQQGAFAPRPAAGEYPPCSRTVTDGCTQTYERGVRRSRPRR